MTAITHVPIVRGDAVAMRNRPCDSNNITASTLILTGKGILCGFLVNSTNAGTIKFWDNTSAAGQVITGTITPAAGAYFELGGDSGIAVNTGIYVTIAGTALDVTILYKPNIA